MQMTPGGISVWMEEREHGLASPLRQLMLLNLSVSLPSLHSFQACSMWRVLSASHLHSHLEVAAFQMSKFGKGQTEVPSASTPSFPSPCQAGLPCIFHRLLKLLFWTDHV